MNVLDFVSREDKRLLKVPVKAWHTRLHDFFVRDKKLPQSPLFDSLAPLVANTAESASEYRKWRTEAMNLRVDYAIRPEDAPRSVVSRLLTIEFQTLCDRLAREGSASSMVNLVLSNGNMAQFKELYDKYQVKEVFPLLGLSPEAEFEVSWPLYYLRSAVFEMYRYVNLRKRVEELDASLPAMVMLSDEEKTLAQVLPDLRLSLSSADVIKPTAYRDLIQPLRIGNLEDPLAMDAETPETLAIQLDSAFTAVWEQELKAYGDSIQGLINHLSLEAKRVAQNMASANYRDLLRQLQMAVTELKFKEPIRSAPMSQFYRDTLVCAVRDAALRVGYLAQAAVQLGLDAASYGIDHDRRNREEEEEKLTLPRLHDKLDSFRESLTPLPSAWANVEKKIKDSLKASAKDQFSEVRPVIDKLNEKIQAKWNVHREVTESFNASRVLCEQYTALLVKDTSSFQVTDAMRALLLKCVPGSFKEIDDEKLPPMWNVIKADPDQQTRELVYRSTCLREDGEPMGWNVWIGVVLTQLFYASL